MSEDVRHERSLILLPSLTDPDIIQQSKLTDREKNILKKNALEKLHWVRMIICFATIIGIKFSVYWLMSYRNLNKDPELLTKHTKADGIGEIKNETEKHDHENR